jgi:hypothetical protein
MSKIYKKSQNKENKRVAKDEEVDIREVDDVVTDRFGEKQKN